MLQTYDGMCNLQDDNFRKVFVGGLHYNTSEDSLKAFYQQWGEVAHTVVMRDQNSQRYLPLLVWLQTERYVYG